MNKYIKIFLAAVVVLGTIFFIAQKLAANKEKLTKKPEIVVIDAASVQVESVSKQKIENNLAIMGTVFADDDVEVYSETQGKVIQLFADKGSYLQQGAVIAVVDDELKRAALMTAEANLEKAKRDLQRFEALFQQKATTEVNVDNARLQVKNLEANLIIAKRQLADSKITAPIAGIMTERFINKGSMVAPGAKIGNLVDMSKLKVRVNVPEEDVFKLKIGDAIALTTPIFPTATFNGSVCYISPKGDAAHTYQVEAYINGNAGYALKSGMFAKVSFLSAPKTESLVISRKALISSLKDPKVYVVEGGVATPRNLIVGNTKDDIIEVVSGLKEGDQVIIDGQINVKENAPVKIVK